MKVYDLKKSLMGGEKMERDYLVNQLESFRSHEPVVYNIETTNACNMRCEMCPRTTIMTRPIETMKPELFKKVIDQLQPFSSDQLSRWEDFVVRNYGIKKDEMNENHYFLYVIPRVIVLHGYGDPLLDKSMPQYVKWMTEKGWKVIFPATRPTSTWNAPLKPSRTVWAM
jgi:predicted alpha/beta-fold hydrolase